MFLVLSFYFDAVQMRWYNRCTRCFTASAKSQENSSLFLSIQNLKIEEVCCHHHSISIFVRQSSRVLTPYTHCVSVEVPAFCFSFQFLCCFSSTTIFIKLEKSWQSFPKNQKSTMFFWQSIFFLLSLSVLFPFGHTLAPIEFNVFETLMDQEFYVQR